SGAERWRRVVDGDASDPAVSAADLYYNVNLDVLRDLAIGPQGNVVAVGITDWNDSGLDMTIVDLQGRNGRDRPAPRWGRCRTRGAKPAWPRWSLVGGGGRRVR